MESKLCDMSSLIGGSAGVEMGTTKDMEEKWPRFRRINKRGVPEASGEVCFQEEGGGQLCRMPLRRSRWSGED